jgi:DNA-binding transcriptional MocR family regulator
MPSRDLPLAVPTHDKATRYLDIAESLQSAILTGRLAKGEQLPTQREMARELGVTQGTVNRAYAELARRGLVSAQVGRGSFVLDSATAGRTALSARTGADFIDMAANKPAGEMHAAHLRRALQEVAKSSELSELMAYQPDAGAWPHRQAASRWLRELGIDAAADRIALTVGAQQANAACLLALTRPGDAVLVEEYTYTGMKSLAASLQRRLEPVAMDEDGLRPEALVDCAERTGAKLLYCMPGAHNPTTAVMPLKRRRQLLAAARRLDLTIVEDGVYDFLGEEALPALVTLAPERTYYLSSLSKSIAPGLRFGMLVAPEGRLQAVAAQTRSLLWTSAPLMAEVASRWIQQGVARELAQTQRAECAQRMAIARNVLQGLSFQWRPHAAHVWLTLPAPWSSADFVAAARRHGVGIAPTEAFSAGRAPEGAAHVRLGLASPSTAHELGIGLNRVIEVLRNSGPVSLPVN